MSHTIPVKNRKEKFHPLKGWRLGRGLGVKHDPLHRTLRLSRYLATLPAPPALIDHYTKVTTLGMMGNDQYGDCVVAAAAHSVQEWSANAGTEKTIPDSTIISTYLLLSPNDTGLYPLDFLNYWTKTGFGGDKIEAFVATDTNLVQAKLAIQLFGSHFIGMSLPDTNTFGPWNVPNPTWAPDPYNGHMVTLIGYDDSKQMFKVITWGELWDMSYGWFMKYVDESYGVLNDIELIKSSGLSPEGFDWSTLQADLAQIKDPIGPPVPVPPPAPPPVPPSPPVPPGPTPPSPTQLVPIFTQRASTNFVVVMDSVNQAPTHTSPFEAAEHAGRLKLGHPGSKVDIISAGDVECTLEAL